MEKISLWRGFIVILLLQDRGVSGELPASSDDGSWVMGLDDTGGNDPVINSL